MSTTLKKIGIGIGAVILLVSLLGGILYLRLNTTGAALGVSRDKSIVMKEVSCKQNYGGGRCGVVIAPLDYQGRDPGTIEVGFIYYPATNPFADEKQITQLVSGGPGISMSSSLADPLLTGVVRFNFRNTALLAIDARGVGRSTRLLCPNASKGDGPAAGLDPAEVAACAAEAGTSRVHYTTENAVRDYERVKRALGIGKINLMGFSYGTNASLVYATLFPKEVRSLILDGAYTPKDTSPVIKESMDALKRQFAAACATSKECTAESASAALAKVVAELRSAPRVLTLPKRTFKLPETALLDVRQLGSMTRFLPGGLDDKHYFPLLGAVLNAAKGDWAKLERIATIYALFTSDPTLTPGEEGVGDSSAMGRAVDCLEVDLAWDPAADIPTRKAQFAKTLAEADARGDVAPFKAEEWIARQDARMGCLYYPTPPRGFEAAKRYAKLDQLPADLPVLIMNGDLDTNTTLESAREMAALIKSSQFARFRYNEHLIIPANYCGATMAAEFLEKQRIADPSRCINSGKLPLDIHNIPPLLEKYLAGEPLL